LIVTGTKNDRFDSDLEKVPRGTHRLVTGEGKHKEIWTKDKCYVHIQRELHSDDQAANDWLREMNFTVITEEEAFPRRAEEQKTAEANAHGVTQKIQ
jgi:hypothetical protein